LIGAEILLLELLGALVLGVQTREGGGGENEREEENACGDALHAVTPPWGCGKSSPMRAEDGSRYTQSVEADARRVWKPTRG
jgi:hypothetical protein